MDISQTLNLSGKTYTIMYPRCVKCNKAAQYFCSTHSKTSFCKMHKFKHHTKIGCDVKAIPDMAGVIQSQVYLSGYIYDIISNTKHHNLQEVVTDVHNMLDLFKTRIDELQLRTDSIIKN